MEDKQAAKERTIDGKVYRHHLRPYSYGEDGGNKEIAPLTLRIYFRLSDSRDTIEVGWIGGHLYNPKNNPPKTLSFPKNGPYRRQGA
jgi:hypothetical protein